MTDISRIALIDDDEAILDSLKMYFTQQNIETSCFPTSKEFLVATERHERFDCIVSDVRMPGMSGLELVHHLKGRNYTAPIILITGHGDVDMAVAAIKVGAFDFIEKPFDEGRLLASIQNAVGEERQREGDATEIENLQSKFETLTTRQREVMDLAVSGLSNKEIGSHLNISTKTVENHRAWVMERIGARNIAQLVRIAMKVKGKI